MTEFVYLLHDDGADKINLSAFHTLEDAAKEVANRYDREETADPASWDQLFTDDEQNRGFLPTFVHPEHRYVTIVRSRILPWPRDENGKPFL